MSNVEYSPGDSYIYKDWEFFDAKIAELSLAVDPFRNVPGAVEAVEEVRRNAGNHRSKLGPKELLTNSRVKLTNAILYLINNNFGIPSSSNGQEILVEDIPKSIDLFPIGTELDQTNLAAFDEATRPYKDSLLGSIEHGCKLLLETQGDPSLLDDLLSVNLGRRLLSPAVTATTNGERISHNRGFGRELMEIRQVQGGELMPDGDNYSEIIDWALDENVHGIIELCRELNPSSTVIPLEKDDYYSLRIRLSDELEIVVETRVNPRDPKRGFLYLRTPLWSNVK